MKVFVSHLEISRSVTEVFGMSLPVVAELRLQYLKCNGPADMTPETVRETFWRDKQQKPPLGIMPRPLWVESRIADIWDAIARYQKVCAPIPHAWMQELADLGSTVNPPKPER